MVAADVFKQESRGGEYKTDSEQEHRDDTVVFSFTHKLSAAYKEGVLSYSNDLKEALVPEGQWPKKIIGVGSSDFIKYSGNGLYIYEDKEKFIRLRIYPDREYVNPHWEELYTGEEVMRLYSNKLNQLSLKLAKPKSNFRVYKKINYRWEAQTFSKTVSALNLELSSGEYLIEKL